MEEGECHTKVGDCIADDKYEPQVVHGACTDCIHAGQNTCITPGIYQDKCFAHCGPKEPIDFGEIRGMRPDQIIVDDHPMYEGDLKHVEGYVEPKGDPIKDIAAPDVTKCDSCEYQGLTLCNKCFGFMQYRQLEIHPNDDHFLELAEKVAESKTGDDMKFDGGKADMSLLEYFPLALGAVCQVSMKGCVKYVRGSFKDVPNARRRYTAAMWRHYFQEGPENGVQEDDELHLPHDYMVAWNALCRLELRLRGHELPQD
jgi:hypothetical protein